MIKTEFMELLEELDRINEGIEDIDFNALTTAEQEADQLWKEIRELDQDYREKVSDAVFSNAEYTELRDELFELEKQLRELKSVYERREWFEVAPGDWEHDDWEDEAAHDTVRDREVELEAEIAKMDANLKAMRTKIESQFEADATNLRTKEAEREKRLATSKNLKGKLAQAYADVEPEVKVVVDFLNSNPEEYEDTITWVADPKSLAYDKNGRVIVRLFTVMSSDRDFDPDDFRENGEMTEYASDYAAESVAEDKGAYPEQIADEFDLEESDLGWYSIPDSKWELRKEAEVYATEAPELSRYESRPATYWQPAESDWNIDGNFVVEASIYIGKKVK